VERSSETVRLAAAWNIQSAQIAKALTDRR